MAGIRSLLGNWYVNLFIGQVAKYLPSEFFSDLLATPVMFNRSGKHVLAPISFGALRMRFSICSFCLFPQVRRATVFGALCENHKSVNVYNA